MLVHWREGTQNMFSKIDAVSGTFSHVSREKALILLRNCECAAELLSRVIRGSAAPVLEP